MLGLNVTVPHKQAVMPLLDEIDAGAQAIGAVNCIVNRNGHLTGHNTDKYGFIRSLQEAGFDTAGAKVVVLGVGGSARAVAYGLAEAGAASISLAGRNAERVEDTASAIETSLPGTAQINRLEWGEEPFLEACGAADLIVNCTPVGMRHTDTEGRSPIGPWALRPDVWVCDLVYNPQETGLLRLTEDEGGHPVSGLEMLVYQAAESLRLWTGMTAPVDIMRKAALAALAERE
jgi:shikimate dehydrogenase